MAAAQPCRRFPVFFMKGLRRNEAPEKAGVFYSMNSVGSAACQCGDGKEKGSQRTKRKEKASFELTERVAFVRVFLRAPGAWCAPLGFSRNQGAARKTPLLLQLFPPHDFGKNQVKVRLVDHSQQQIVVWVHQRQGFRAVGAGKDAQGFRKVHVRGKRGHVAA